MAHVPTHKQTVAYPLSRIVLAGVTAIALSIIANVLIRWLGMLLVEVPADLQALGSVAPVIFFTALFIVVATVVWGIITRVSRTPERTWTIAALLGLVLSLVPDVWFAMLEQPTPMGTFSWSAVAVLTTMHIFSGVITWWVLPRLSRA